MYPLAVLSHFRPRFANILGHYGHARSHGRRQPDAAKAPWYNKLIISAIAVKDVSDTVMAKQSQPFCDSDVPGTTYLVYVDGIESYELDRMNWLFDIYTATQLCIRITPE